MSPFSDQILLCDRLPFYLETGLAFFEPRRQIIRSDFRTNLQIPCW